MSIKLHKVLPLLTIVLVHLLIIYIGGYFLSTEFTVYPYLSSVGLKPYLSLIDQHLPIIFFGPLSFPKFFTSNPQPLLALFLGLVALTDVLFFCLLKNKKIIHPLLWTSLFAITMFVFQGNTLWLETFIIPLVLLMLMLKESFFIGLLSALIILIRPTLAPAILLLFIFKKRTLSRNLVAGFLFPLLVTLTYLVYHQLLPPFIYIFINFNSNIYSVLAEKLPSLRQLALVGLVTIPAMLLLLKNKKYLSIIVLTLFFIPAWPRFELTHIQPAIALAIFFFAKNNKSPGHSERSEESLSLSEISHSREILRHAQDDNRTGVTDYPIYPIHQKNHHRLLRQFLLKPRNPRGKQFSKTARAKPTICLGWIRSHLPPFG